MAQVGELPVKVLLTCAEVGRTTAVGRTISRLTLELERLSAVVIVAQSARDAMSVLVTDPDVPVAVVDWDLCEVARKLHPSGGMRASSTALLGPVAPGLTSRRALRS